MTVLWVSPAQTAFLACSPGSLAEKTIPTRFDKIANFQVARVSKLRFVKRWHDVRDGQSRTRSKR
jgi:hypothetical protein